MQEDLSINEWDIIIVQVESLFHVEFTARPFVAILDEANAIMCQMSSGTNAQESENVMRDILRSARHVLAMDAFVNKSTLAFFRAYHGEDIHIVDNGYQPRIGEKVKFIYDLNSGAEAMRIGYDLLRQGKHPDNSPVRSRAYYGDMDGKQRQIDFSNINVAWSKLDCIAYTNTVEAGISFEVTGHFDIVIAITNITTPVHVEALAQMLYRIRDCSRRIVSIFYQKNSNDLFRPLGHENIRAELANARPNNLPTSIKDHCEWNSNTVSYKINESPAVITFIEVEHQKHLSARYFIEKLCSLVASTGASLQLIKMDESRGVIGNYTIAFKCFYIQNIYGKDMDDEIWDNFCNKKFEDTYYKARYNSEKSVVEDLHKSYSFNHWMVIRELFQILGFTGIDDKRTLSSDTASESFMRSCEKFIKIRNQSLLLFGFKSCAKETLDLHSAIKTINAIAENWCEYTVESNKKRIGPKEQQVRQYSY
ncbi:13777_t:CDS:2 [Funneliformis geosporum]|nr:13777_t:CDS:2 [Funneliformis geosporum]